MGGGRTSDLQVEWMETLGWEAVDSNNDIVGGDGVIFHWMG